MKTLVLITSNYPFGTSEPFPEKEIPFLQSEFNKIIIVAQNVHSPQTRRVPSGTSIYRYNPSTTFKGFIELPFLLLINIKLILSLIREEKEFRELAGVNLGLSREWFLYKKIIKAIQLRDYVKKILHKENISSEIIFYSYWLNSGSHAIALLDNRNSIKIARAHRIDLYEEVTGRGYLPLLKHVAEKLDAIFFISEQGMNYFSSRVTAKAELFVSRLGVLRSQDNDNNQPETDEFTIVSCSNMIPVKRINLIIEALSLTVFSKKTRWIHFGSGILREELGKMAQEKLHNKEKLRYEFKGYIPNDEIMEFYSKHIVNLFVNTSFSEGVPVSIMEAQSYGIPVLATDTGGVSEIVAGGTGYLLPVDFRPDELSGKISRFINMEPDEEKKFREKAFSNWNHRFNAQVNYPEFVSILNRIFDRTKVL